MVDCNQNRADRPKSDFAIPRLKKLPYKINGEVKCSCVKNAMARHNQVKDATDEELSKAKSLLIRVARNSCDMDVDWSSLLKELELENWSVSSLLALHKKAHDEDNISMHFESMLCLIDGYDMLPPDGEFENSELDYAWREFI